MSHRVHAGRISNLAVLILALGGGGVLAAAPAADDRLIVRVAVADLPANLLERVDTCAIERTASGRGAVLLLSPQEAAGLDVPHEVLGTLADHYRRFMPVNTIRRKAVPSLERYAQEVAPARRAAGEDPCAGIGVTLAPYDEYHNLAEGMCFLEKLADAYPQITDLRTIGASLEDRPIRALRITDQPGAVEASEQRILFTGVTHAREWATHEVMLYIAEQLTSGYGRDPRITSIVDHCEIWLVPVVNPDGYVYSWDEDPMWRKNRRELGTCDGVDINRNYDFNWGPHPGSSGNTCSEIYRGSAPASEPETQVIQNLLAQNDFAVGVSFHSYAQLVLFAWGHTTEVKPESYSTLRALARGYSTRVLDSHGELYIPGQSSYTIYLTNGDFDDYAYGAHGVLSFTPEVRPDSFAEGGFMLPEDQILEACEENMAGALWLMEVVAGASEVQRAGGGPLLADMPGNGGGFSLPVSPANQKPDAALAFPAAPSGALSTWLDDTEHDPPFEGTWGADFEGVGAGSAYRADVGIDAVSAWAQELQSYVGLPGVFADGAEVMLSNVEPGLNWIGLPGAAPLRLAEVQVIKRRLASTGQEEVLEQRGALQDAAAPAPWLNWTWTTRDSQGRVEHAHPTGDGGASAYILPYRLYEVQVHVPSATFDSTILPVYLLRFPPADPDCDDNGLDDAEELAAGLAADCNRNEVVDACEIEAGAAQDCNGNGVPDGCELSTAYEALSPLLGPLDSGSPLSFMLADPPVAAAAVSIEVQARGDLGGTSEYLDIDINGLHAGRVFEAGGQDCPAKPETALFAVGGDAYNAALAGGDALFEIMPSSEVDDGQCKGSEVRLKISYARPDPDCNGNQVLDTCDLAGGISADCNADHIPDDCQLHADFQAGSPQFSPLAAGVSHEWLVDPAPPAAGSVGLSLSAVGDLGAAGEHVEIYINDQLAARAFDHEASDCPPSPDVHSLALPASL
jgi:hypothetical protein